MSTALATMLGTIIGTAIGAISSIIVCIINNKKQNDKQNALVIYRLEQLERKVDKHNNIVERMYIAEGKIDNMQQDIKELKAG